MNGEANALALLEALYAGAPVGLGVLGHRAALTGGSTTTSPRSTACRRRRTSAAPRASCSARSARRPRSCSAACIETRRPVVDRELTGETPAAPGRTRRWRTSFYPVHDGAGEPLGVGMVALEVTEQHEAASRESEALREADEAARREPRRSPGRAPRCPPRCAPRRSSRGSCAPRCPPLGRLVLDPPRAAGRGTRADRGRRTPTPRASRSRGSSTSATRGDPDAPTGAAHVIRTGEREVFREIPEELLVAAAQDEDHLRIIRELDLRSAAVLPLTARGAVLGALTLVMAESGRTYEPELVELAESLAAGAGLALDNARLYAEQRDVARALQRTLLPAELPAIPGAELAARYRAAGRSNEVGGDFYDVFEAAEGGWTFVIGDVVGKGAEAAAVTSLVRATLQAAALRGDGPNDAPAAGRRGAAPRGRAHPVLLRRPRLPAPRAGGRARPRAAQRRPPGAARPARRRRSSRPSTRAAPCSESPPTRSSARRRCTCDPGDVAAALHRRRHRAARPGPVARRGSAARHARRRGGRAAARAGGARRAPGARAQRRRAARRPRAARPPIRAGVRCGRRA